MSINRSKPIYSPLKADPTGRFHVMLASAQGADALQRVLGEFAATSPESLGIVRVMVVDAAIDPFVRLGLAGAHAFADTHSLLPELHTLLARCKMGTRLYVAGPENFIGQVMQVALHFNLNPDEVRAEALGTLARRVHCVHCRATTHGVVTNLARCTGCSRWLTVRDHYSRRFAAYMGVMAAAEVPGELPPSREIFS